MARIDLEAFTTAYRQAVVEILPFLTRDRQALIARHNLGLHPDRHDLHAYLRASERRYVLAVERFNDHNELGAAPVTALDVGGFLGAFPLALARVGVGVTLVEEYELYHGAFDDLKAFLEAHGVGVWAMDFTQPLPELPERRFGLITNMAMIEHLPSSPKALVDNLHRCLDERGILVLEAPNIAYWPNRLRALRGDSIHQDFDLYYASVPPWIGHHREYTAGELRDLLAWGGFSVRSLDLHNYSLSLREGSWHDRLYVLAVYLWPTLLFANCREVILAAAAPTPMSARPPAPGALSLLNGS